MTRHLRNLVGLLFIGSLVIGEGTLVGANFDPTWCDDPSHYQNGAVCEYSSDCGWSGVSDPYGVNMEYCGASPSEAMAYVYGHISFFCYSFANARGDPLGYVGSWGGTPYFVDIPEVFYGYCSDGEFTCNWMLEGTCPS